ncbi:hypothetical protein HDV03_005283 [Kappamyces sp. JEL0829]|nr:hypothetical protein HDV03_005283 [Kappamyces sp. JEL0829]
MGFFQKAARSETMEKYPPPYSLGQLEQQPSSATFVMNPLPAQPIQPAATTPGYTIYTTTSIPIVSDNQAGSAEVDNALRPLRIVALCIIVPVCLGAIAYAIYDLVSHPITFQFADQFADAAIVAQFSKIAFMSQFSYFSVVSMASVCSVFSMFSVCSFASMIAFTSYYSLISGASVFGLLTCYRCGAGRIRRRRQ